MKKPLAPCQDCPRREMGCHARCEDYIQYTKLRDEFRDWKFQENADRCITLNEKTRKRLFKPKK